MITTYTERGWKVFPLTKNTKTPATPNGFKDASTDPHTIKAGQNVGIATGKGLLVLDIDRKHGKDGGEVLASLEREHGKLPATLTATTPSGGEHLYFSYPANVAIQSRANICKEHGEGLDIRADGGYIVAPPSRTEASADPKGKTATGDYVWTNSADVAELPAAWLELLRAKERTRTAPEPRTFTPDSDRMAELQDALTHIDPHPHDDWVKVGMALYSLGNDGLSLWDVWSSAANNYDPQEIPKRWKSFSNTSVNVESVFHMAQENGWQNPAKKNRTRTQYQGKPHMNTTENTTENTTTEPQDAGDTNPSLALIREAIAKLDIDPGAILEPQVLTCFLSLSAPDNARVMAEIKATKRVKMSELERGIKQLRGSLNGGGDDDKEGSIASKIVEYVQEMADLFVDEEGNAYARIKSDSHHETWMLGSKGFNEWIAAAMYRTAELLPKAEAIKDATNSLSGLAKYGNSDEKRKVFLRAGVTDAGAYVIDLCNDEWQSIIVEPGKWSLDTAQTVAFRRASTNKALPVPLAAGAGNVDKLWQLVNVKESDRNMLLAWMLECFRPDTAYPVLELSAEQGSGKSSAQNVIRELIDPNAANLRGKPRSPEDIFVSAHHSLMVSYENLSHLTDDMQDAFCILATGGGMAGRLLHTNLEESVMSAKRPVVMNGIGTLATRQDLVDRSNIVELLPFADTDRKTDTELKAMFDECKAEIFTGLLDLFAKALEILPKMQIDKLPRMADFALFGSAVYAARGVAEPEKAFMADYMAMRNDAIFRTLDSSPVAAAIILYLEQHKDGAEFSTAKAALDALSVYKSDGESFPKSGKGLSEALKRLAPAFRQIGIRAETAKIRTSQGFPVIIKPITTRATPAPVTPINAKVAGML